MYDFVIENSNPSGLGCSCDSFRYKWPFHLYPSVAMTALLEHPRDTHVRYQEQLSRLQEGDLVDAAAYAKVKIELHQGTRRPEPDESDADSGVEDEETESELDEEEEYSDSDDDEEAEDLDSSDEEIAEEEEEEPEEPLEDEDLGSDDDEDHTLEDGTSTATFYFTHEDHTLGNALRHVLMQQPTTITAGYTIPHPLEPTMVLHLQSEQYSIDALCDGLESLATICDKTVASFEAALLEAEIEGEVSSEESDSEED